MRRLAPLVLQALWTAACSAQSGAGPTPSTDASADRPAAADAGLGALEGAYAIPALSSTLRATSPAVMTRSGTSSITMTVGTDAEGGLVVVRSDLPCSLRATRFQIDSSDAELVRGQTCATTPTREGYRYALTLVRGSVGYFNGAFIMSFEWAFVGTAANGDTATGTVTENGSGTRTGGP